MTAEILSMNDDDDYLNAWEFVQHLPTNMQACRGGRNHNFIDGEQIHGDVSSGIVHTETLCARGCMVIKVEDWVLGRGYYVDRPHYKYPKEYLVKQSENGPIHPADMAAAIRLMNFYRKQGKEIPKPTRRRRRRIA